MSNTKQIKPKRLLSLLLTLVMVLGLLPTTAFAANPIYISTITGTVTGLTAPVCGAKVGTIAPKFTFTEESHATANIGSTSCWEKYDDYYGRWYKWWESQPSGGLFTPGKWRFKQEIYMNEGYVRDTSSFSVVINGETWKSTNFDSEPTFCIAYSPEYTVSAGTATLSEARSGVAVTPVFDGYLNELNAQGKLSFQWMRKASGGSGFIQIPGATGSSYTPTDSDVGAIIYVAVWETERKVVTSSVVSNQVVVKASVGHTLNSVQASVTVPTVGASKEDCVPRLTTANMTIDHYNWYYTGSGSQTNLRSENFTTFEDDGNYLCLIYVKPNSTYAFADDATGMVNGKTAETQNGTDLVRLSYAVKVAKPPILSGQVQFTSAANVSKSISMALLNGSVTVVASSALRYQWQIKNGSTWVNLNDSYSDQRNYVPTSEQEGKELRIVITANGYEGSIVSDAITVTKAFNPASPSKAPDLEARQAGSSYTTLRVYTKAGQDYVWCDSQEADPKAIDWSVNAFTKPADADYVDITGLTEGTTYYVYTRISETESTQAGVGVKYSSLLLMTPNFLQKVVLEGYTDYGDGNTIYIPVGQTVTINVEKYPADASTWSYFTFGDPSLFTYYFEVTSPTEQVQETMPTSITLKGNNVGGGTLKAYYGINDQYGSWRVIVYDTLQVGQVTFTDKPAYDDISLYVGDSYTPTAPASGLLLPTEANDGRFEYRWYLYEGTDSILGSPYGTTTNNGYLSIDPETGKVTALSANRTGTHQPYVKLCLVDKEDTSKYQVVTEYKVTVKGTGEIPVESVTVVPSTTTMAPGTSITPTAIINPSNHTVTSSVAWWSKVSGSDSITVDSNTGKVTVSSSAVDGDTATIRATFGDKHGECSITVSTIKYGVTVTDGTATVSGTGISKAAEGTTITLTANTAPICQVFDKWVVEDESASITLADATSANTTFIMPASSVSVKATYKDAPGLTSITNANVTVTAPVKGGTPANATTADTQYTVTSTLWLPVDDPFEPSTVYNVMVALKVNEGNQFTSDTAFKINGENATVLTQSAGYAQISYIFPATASSGSSSGGSSGGGVSTYAITVDSAKNGDVTSSHKSAAKGTTITLTVEPDKGYTLETITATDASGNKLKLTEKDGKYTFTMPASKVTVKATFMEDNSMLNFFVDVPADAYYYDAVLWAAEKGITGGVDAAHFAPNATCTRAQAVTFLWRAAGSPTPKSSEMPFTDVAPGSYYETAVLWAVENGITKGTSDTTFTPNAKCTRAQIVTFLWRSQKSPASDSVNPLTDVAADAYYNTAVLWAVKEDVTKGTTNTTFSPDANCTRAQIVTFIWRALAE